MKKLNALLTLVLINYYTASAQPEFSKWFLNTNTGITFTTNPPSFFGGFALGVSEGCANICDSQGNLLFYCNGVTINDASHNTMANGSGLIGNTSTTQGALIVKQPGNNNIYFVFTLDEGTSGNQGAYYSVVDMSLAAGLGSVVAKNNFLYAPNLEKQVAIRHCNGKDVWIISHEANNNNFRAYLLTFAGLNPTPVLSGVGNIFYGIGSVSAGELKASPDGTKLGWATPSPGPGSSVSPYGFHLFDFDASTGIVSNPLTLLTCDQAYGVEFSPDGTKLYGTRRILTSPATSTLCQWDICQTNTATIVSSLYTTTASSKFSAIQRGIDNKLYLVNVGTLSLSVIHNPNSAGSAMNFAPNSLVLGGGLYCNQGLPNYITGYAKPQNLQILTSIKCQQGTFTAPSYTIGNGCTTAPYPVNAYLWNFGDTNSGSANTSTVANPVHYFTTPGTYTVSLIVYSNCENDTLTRVVNIVNSEPVINITGNFTVCKGDKTIYTASGGTTYLWNGTTNSQTIALAPVTTTVYNVTGTNSVGCTATTQFTVSVNPCLNASPGKGNDPEMILWPNPFQTKLNVQVTESTRIELLNLEGVRLLDVLVQTGANSIDTSAIPAGCYILRTNNSTSSSLFRFVKVE